MWFVVIDCLGTPLPRYPLCRYLRAAITQVNVTPMSQVVAPTNELVEAKLQLKVETQRILTVMTVKVRIRRYLCRFLESLLPFGILQGSDGVSKGSGGRFTPRIPEHMLKGVGRSGRAK